MRRPHRVLAVAAAALLAAGCEYWRNLTQEVTPDRGVVTLTVRDALTGEPLADAGCGKAGQRLHRADGDGVIRRDDMPTGKYDLVCEAPFYRTRTIAFELRLGETNSDTVWLVREGGDRWYPSVPGRRVAIQLRGGNGRYPGPLVVEAVPFDSAERYWYQWSSNLHAVPPMSTVPLCTLFTGRSPLDSQDLALGLKVYFKPKGDAQMYLVDSTTRPMKLERNRSPEIVLNPNFKREPVGCFDEPDSIRFVYLATDPDGDAGCQVRVTSTDPSRPAGRIDTLVPCGLQAFAFHVVTHPGSTEEPISLDSYLKLEVQDQNGEKHSATFVGRTTSNVPPSIDLKLLNPSHILTAAAEAQLRVIVDDYEGGRLQNVHLDWGDGHDTTVNMRFAEISNDLADTANYRHTYANPGEYSITAKVFDGCKGVDSLVLDILVR